MTGKELLEILQKLPEEDLNRDIIIFDGPSYYTPYKVEVLTDKKWGKRLQGKLMID